jgi:hypothetical protein
MQVFFLLVEFFEVVVDAIVVLGGEDVLDEDYHVIVMNEEHQFAVPLLFYFGEVVVLAAVELDLVLDEVDHFHEASLHILQELLVLQDVTL